jgi:hypothetical protein
LTDKSPKLHLWINKDSLFINKEGDIISDDLVFSGENNFQRQLYHKEGYIDFGKE